MESGANDLSRLMHIRCTLLVPSLATPLLGAFSQVSWPSILRRLCWTSLFPHPGFSHPTDICLVAAFPLFGIQMYEKLGYQWATALLAFLTLAMLPFPFLFFIYGKKLRGRSKFAKKD